MTKSDIYDILETSKKAKNSEERIANLELIVLYLMNIILRLESKIKD
jgi:hypothetical protein